MRAALGATVASPGSVAGWPWVVAGRLMAFLPSAGTLVSVGVETMILRPPRPAQVPEEPRPGALRPAPRAGRSEPQLPQLPRVALPVLRDRHVQVQKDLRAQQGLDLPPGRSADGAQPLAATADHDALLAGA